MNYFLDILHEECKKYIPYGEIRIFKQTHPWLDKTCEEAISIKNNAIGTGNFAVAQEHCAEVISDRHQDYINRLKEQMMKLPKGTKKWWRLNRELLDKKTKVTSVPPLKSANGEWHLGSESKANLLAAGFREKLELPPDVEDQYVARPEFCQQEFVAIQEYFENPTRLGHF